MHDSHPSIEKLNQPLHHTFTAMSSRPSPLPRSSPSSSSSSSQPDPHRSFRSTTTSVDTPQWTINIDRLDEGVESWKNGGKRNGRVVLVLGGESRFSGRKEDDHLSDLRSLMIVPQWNAIKPVLISQDFKNTLVVFAHSPTSSTAESKRSIGSPLRGPTSESIPPSSPAPDPRTRSSSFPSFRSSSTPAINPNLPDPLFSQTQALILSLTEQIQPDVHFLKTGQEDLAGILRDVKDVGGRWREGRRLKWMNEERNGKEQDIGSPRSSTTERFDGAGSSSSRTRSGRRVSTASSSSLSPTKPGGGRNRRTSLTRSFSSVVGLLTAVKDENPPESTRGFESDDKGSTGTNKLAGSDVEEGKTFDAIVHFMRDDAGMQNWLKEVVMVATALLPHLDSTQTASNIKRSSTPTEDSLRQTIIHVLPKDHPPELIPPLNTYLSSLFPSSSSIHHRAYLLNHRVLPQPMKRAMNQAEVSGLGLILSGAVGCKVGGKRGGSVYLQGLRSCRFVGGGQSDKMEGTEQARTTGPSDRFRFNNPHPVHVRSFSRISEPCIEDASESSYDQFGAQLDPEIGDILNAILSDSTGSLGWDEGEEVSRPTTSSSGMGQGKELPMTPPLDNERERPVLVGGIGSARTSAVVLLTPDSETGSLDGPLFIYPEGLTLDDENGSARKAVNEKKPSWIRRFVTRKTDS